MKEIRTGYTIEAGVGEEFIRFAPEKKMTLKKAKETALNWFPTTARVVDLKTGQVVWPVSSD